jgi:large subunit ribosomal protein L13
MIVDAEDKILGRLATTAARKAKKGETVKIINAEKAVISGDEKEVKEDYKQKYDRGTRHDGPYYPKAPHMILKRVVRDMLPYKSSEGREQLGNIKAYIGHPHDLDDPEELDVKEGNDLKHRNYVKLGEVSKFMGWTPLGETQ